MLILFVNGIPALKLGGPSEIPSHQGMEPWQVRDESGRTVDFYQPEKAGKPRRQHAAQPERRIGMAA